MHKIISWYNQNRRRILFVVMAAVIIVLIVWRLIDMVSINNPTTEIQDSKIDTNTFNSITMSSQKSAISGETVDISQEKISVIDNFISYCNSGKIQEAYNLISNECKEEMYPSIKDFQEVYYKPVFGQGKKNVTVENWVGDIYVVDFNEDFLSTGKATGESSLRDYITIVRDEEDSYKLNINKYIKQTAINKTIGSEKISIKIVKKDIYMDYEIYTFEVTNNSVRTIALGNIQDLEASYLTDSNGLKYRAYMSELSQAQITCPLEDTKTIKIKYNNQYSSSRKITNLVFPRAILDYEVYEKTRNYTNYAQINFDL